MSRSLPTRILQTAVLLLAAACPPGRAPAQAPPPASGAAAAHPVLPSGRIDLFEQSLPDAYLNLPFRASIQIRGGIAPFTLNLTGDLPPGIAGQFAGSVLTLAGAPTHAGLYEVHIFANDRNGLTITRDFSLDVHPETTPPAINISDPETITLTDTPHVFFPVVLHDTESIVLDDSPNEFGPTMPKIGEPITLTDTVDVFFPKATNVAETITLNDIITIQAAIGISPATIASGAYSQAYTPITFAGVGNSGPVTLSSSGSPAPGMSLTNHTSTIVLSGTPTAVGSYPFSITAKDSVSQSTVQYTLVIAQAAQTIQLGAIPSVSYPGSPFTLTATATSGLPVTITSTSALATGSNPFTPTAPGEASFTATQPGNANYAAAPSVGFNVPIKGTAIITWNPSSLIIPSGLPLTAAVLDATASAPGLITYTAGLLPANIQGAVTASSILPTGTFDLVATFTPTDSAVYSVTTKSITITVSPESVFAANANGTLSSFYTNGQLQSGPIAGGGIGLAIDQAGDAWSINASQSALSQFTDVGQLLTGTIGSGTLANAAALVFDGASRAYIVTADTGNIYAIPSATGIPTLTAQSSTLTHPTAASIDTSGNLWVTDSSSNSVTEILGLAAPVLTPLAAAVAASTPASKP